MFCPKCRTEYREGFYICVHCNSDLVYELPPEERPEFIKSRKVSILEITNNTREMILRIIQESPILPRRVNLLSLFLSILRTRPTISVMIFWLAVLGVGLGIIPFWIASSKRLGSGELVGGGFISSLLVIPGLLGLSATVRFLILIYSAVRAGPVADAVIESLTVHPPSYKSPVAAAEGTRRVHCTNRTFVEKFQIDEPWVSELKIGAVFKVLVHPKENRSVVELGIKP